MVEQRGVALGHRPSRAVLAFLRVLLQVGQLEAAAEQQVQELRLWARKENPQAQRTSESRPIPRIESWSTRARGASQSRQRLVNGVLSGTIASLAYCS